jgi:hypothetical protein
MFWSRAGAWKIEDLYTFHGEFVAAGSLNQTFFLRLIREAHMIEMLRLGNQRSRSVMPANFIRCLSKPVFKFLITMNWHGIRTSLPDFP